MKRTSKRAALLLAVALTPLVTAHHSFSAEYDQTRPLMLVGRVTKVIVENPHGWIYIETKRSDGRTIVWQVEMPAPATLNRNGSGKDVLDELVLTGEQVSVSVFAARDESKHAWGSSLQRQDGKTVIRLGENPSAGPNLRGN